MDKIRKAQGTAVVTGASSGIGQSIYRGLKGLPYFDRVIGISRSGPDLAMDVRSVPTDRFFSMAPVLLLVNCAGIMPLDEGGQERDIFDVNFWGTYNMIKDLEGAFVPGSCIINMASISGIVNDADIPIYSASKAALISLTKSLAKKYAPNIRVNCISPGFFYPTNLVPEAPPKELTDPIPMQYVAHPDELFPIVEMIFRSRYMTGANIVVDGGLSC